MKHINKQTIGTILTTAALALVGCAGGGGSAKLRQLSSPTLEQPTVAVLPFQSAQSGQLKPDARMVRDFEHNYLPSRLIRALQATPGVASAYYSATATPAADLNIKAEIKKSDGRTTDIGITVLGADGHRVSSRSFTVKISSEEFKKNPDPAGRIWQQIAATVAKAPQKPGDFAAARVAGYVGSNKELITDTKAELAQQAATAERQGMLAPVTGKMMPRAAAVDATYLSWQQESTPLIEKRNSEKRQQAASVFTALVGAAAGGVGAASGNTALATQAGELVGMSISDIETSAAKIQEINKTLETVSKGLVWHDGQPTTIRVFGEVHKFSGSLENQQAELRQIVQQHLASASGTQTPVPETPAKRQKRAKTLANN